MEGDCTGPMVMLLTKQTVQIACRTAVTIIGYYRLSCRHQGGLISSIFASTVQMCFLWPPVQEPLRADWENQVFLGVINQKHGIHLPKY